ncbi:serine protease [Dysgonomonas sp. 520]|nr:serine protease [Dysgonomonas sp. 520]
MESPERVYWYIAIGASIVFVLLTIASFFGGDSDVDVETQVGEAESPFHLFSLRNIINFLLGFGWTGVVFYGNIENQIILGLLAILVGALFVAVFFMTMRSFLKLTENNTFSLEQAVGKTGNVYLKIPPQKTGKGKVLISVKGSVRELEAVTEDESAIETGRTVEVVAVEGSALIVKRV